MLDNNFQIIASIVSGMIIVCMGIVAVIVLSSSSNSYGFKVTWSILAILSTITIIYSNIKLWV